MGEDPYPCLRPLSHIPISLTCAPTDNCLLSTLNSGLFGKSPISNQSHRHPSPVGYACRWWGGDGQNIVAVVIGDSLPIPLSLSTRLIFSKHRRHSYSGGMGECWGIDGSLICAIYR